MRWQRIETIRILPYSIEHQTLATHSLDELDIADRFLEIGPRSRLDLVMRDLTERVAIAPPPRPEVRSDVFVIGHWIVRGIAARHSFAQLTVKEVPFRPATLQITADTALDAKSSTGTLVAEYAPDEVAEFASGHAYTPEQQER